jgi:glycosyltransferase involved in cell wall biosynthesis
MKNFTPLVSIVIPVYNGSNYVREAIDSALSQTYKNIEIIVVNDGSTDNTEEIVKSYGNKLRYFKKENGGTSTALNLAIQKMKGEYFSWLSHDDLYYPDKIEKQIEELSRLDNKNTIMMSDLDGIDEKYKKKYKTNYIKHINQYPLREKSYIYPIIYNKTHGCTLLIPKICFDKVGLFDEESVVAQDFEFFYRAFLKFPHKLVPKVLVTARDSSNRQGRRNKVRCSLDYSNLFIHMIDNLSDADIKLLATNKLSFYYDMQCFFRTVGYTKALEYINKKIIKNFQISSYESKNKKTIKNLQISSYDLIGNKFNGYDLHLCLRENEIDSKDLVLVKESNDANTYSYNFDVKDATRELLKQKIFFETDIVHLHMVHNILDLNYLPIISRLKPTILSLHDPFFLGGHCVHHFDCKKWQTHCKDCLYLDEMFTLNNDWSALDFELKKEAIQNSKITAIVASEWMKNKVKKSPIWKNKKVYFLPLGIDQELFSKVDTKLAKNKFDIEKESIVLMFRTDAGSYKGLDIIKKALLKLESSKKITLISVGQRGLLKEFDNKFNIIEYDWIKDDKLLANLYQACDIFLMPSRQETFGMMAVEAMSCGKMVLALDSEGSALPEVINSPICGLAVSEKIYTEELQRLINNPEEIIKRSKKSLDFARGKYSKTIYIKEIIKIYKEVINNHHQDDGSKLVLQQLKKYMMFETQNYRIDNYNSETSLSKNFINKRKIKDYFIISFYVFDKLIPKSIRKVMKTKLVKFNFVKKYLIK